MTAGRPRRPSPHEPGTTVHDTAAAHPGSPAAAPPAPRAAAPPAAPPPPRAAPPRLPLLLLTGLLTGLLVAPAVAGPPRAVPVTDERTADAAADVLRRAARAAKTLTWSGTQFVSAWSADGATSHVVEVAHRPGIGLAVRVDAAVDDREAVATVPDAPDPIGPVASGALALLADRYALSLAEPGRVAGRDADVVDVRRRGAAVPAARFWVDRATGLVLRREVYDADGRRVRASAYVDLVVGEASMTAAQQVAPRGDAGTRLGATDLAALRADGWPAPASLGDLVLHDARRRDDVVQLSYSDGLSSVSLFTQRGHLDRDALRDWRRREVDGDDVWVRSGVPQQLTWTDGGRVLTVVADAPPRVVEEVVAALPHRRDRDGLLGRLGRGLGRVLSWLNPFD